MYYVELDDGSNRKANDNEILVAQANKNRFDQLRSKRDKLDAEILNLEQRCEHKVFVDTPGLPYDVRSCYACGKYLGFV